MLRIAARTLRPVRDTTKHLRFGERPVSAILKESLTRQASLLGFDCISVVKPFLGDAFRSLTGLRPSLYRG